MKVTAEKPCTVYVRFLGVTPVQFELYDTAGDLYFFRALHNTPRIKFNIVHPGTYSSNAPFEVVKITDIEIPSTLPALPAFERNREKPLDIQFNADLDSSPARIFSHTGKIEVGARFYELPKAVRLFILLHEAGHLYYETETKCDMFALIHFLKMGYNRSTAFYALSRVLRRTKEATERLNALIGYIQKTQSNKL